MHSKKYMEVHFQDSYNSLLVESLIPELMDQGSIPELMESSNSERNSTIISTDNYNSLLVAARSSSSPFAAKSSVL